MSANGRQDPHGNPLFDVTITGDDCVLFSGTLDACLDAISEVLADMEFSA